MTMLDLWRPTMLPRTLWREIEDLERRFDYGWKHMPSLWDREETWTPAVDIIDKEDRYLVRVEVPGMKKEDIDVSLHDGVLTIKGERKCDSEYKEEDYTTSEFYYGSFYRAFTLPGAVDETKVEATYEDGILEIYVPKSPEVKPKKIEISGRKPRYEEKTPGETPVTEKK